MFDGCSWRSRIALSSYKHGRSTICSQIVSNRCGVAGDIVLRFETRNCAKDVVVICSETMLESVSDPSTARWITHERDPRNVGFRQGGAFGVTSIQTPRAMSTFVTLFASSSRSSLADFRNVDFRNDDRNLSMKFGTELSGRAPD